MTKTLFIGLDGATFTILDRLIADLPDEGVTMPFMKRFVDGGARAKLFSTPNPLTPPAWTSIMTGRSPGNHGVYDFIRAEEKGDEVYFTLYDARDIATETIWSIATRNGKKVVALNFPLTAPPRPNSGISVPGFVPWKHLRRNVAPSGLFDRLKEIDGFNPKELAWDFDLEKQAMEKLSEEETERWVKYHLPREEQWFRIAEHLMDTEQPELMAIMFDGTDKIQHQAWRFLDPRLPRDNWGEWEYSMRRVCLSYFRALDGYIERLVELAGPDSRVFMASDHGFTASTEVLRINAFLEEKGYLQWADYGEDADIAERRANSNFAAVDWKKTTAYCRTPSSNGIYIRVADRPGSFGIPTDEYHEFRERIIADLESIVDDATGERIVTKIMRREDVFAGEFMHEAPDLTLVLRDFGFVSIRNLHPPLLQRDEIVGTHHPDGVMLANGVGIAATDELEPRDIVDVAPTLLYSLGLPVPKDFEGVVPESFFVDKFLEEQPVTIGKPTSRTNGAQVDKSAIKAGAVDEVEMDEQEKAALMEQLQMLGYME